MRSWFLLAAFTLSSASAWGFTGDLTTQHPYAVAVYKEASGGLCGGTLIAPNLVLTARHCVTEALDGKTSTDRSMALGELRVAFCSDVRTNCTNSVTISAIDAPKAGTRSGITKRDIALLHLSKNVPSSWATPVTPVLKKVSTILEGKKPALFGVSYGPSYTNGTDGLVRRLKSAVGVTCIGTACRKVDAGDPTPNKFLDDVEGGEFASTANYVKGDSGSGVFVKNADGSVNLIAVASHTLGAIIGGHDTSAFTVFERTDEWKSEIVSAGKKAATNGPRLSWADGSKGTYTAPSWTK